MTHLNRDHRERKNVGFFAVWPLLVQDLWRSPSRGMTLVTQSDPRGIQIWSGRGQAGQAEIRDPCITNTIDENIRLDTCRYSGKIGFR